VRASIPWPSYESLMFITGYTGDGMTVVVNVSVSHYDVDGPDALPVPFRGVPGGDSVSVSGLPIPPPPSPPMMPPPMPIAPPSAPAFGGLLDLGGAFTCGSVTGYTLKCWGQNGNRQLGFGSYVQAPRTNVPINQPVTHLATGSMHTCAVGNGELKCWGRNDNGQCGLGTQTSTVTSPSTVNIGGSVELLDAPGGGYGRHTCATLTDGTLKCWGLNAQGQCGIGSSSTYQSNSPATVNVGGTVSILKTGGRHTCVVLTDGTLKCWGHNFNGQMGDGTTTQRDSPITVNVGGAVELLALSDRTTCAKLVGGSLKCWGKNDVGQLGIGTTTESLTPVTVDVGGTVAQIAAGDNHFCVVLTDDTLKCWGYNYYGGLGVGLLMSDLVFSTTPRTVNVGGAVSYLALGGSHTCAWLVDGTLKCWGNNQSGQVGDDSYVHRASPVTVNIV